MRSTTDTAAAQAGTSHAPRTGALRRHLTWLLLLKFAALALLWLVCFSPAHRTRVGPEAAAARIAAPPSAAARDTSHD